MKNFEQVNSKLRNGRRKKVKNVTDRKHLERELGNRCERNDGTERENKSKEMGNFGTKSEKRTKIDS